MRITSYFKEEKVMKTIKFIKQVFEVTAIFVGVAGIIIGISNEGKDDVQ